MNPMGPMIKSGTGTNDNDIVIELTSNAEHFETWQLSSTAGAMDVFVSSDGTNYLTAPLALIDLASVNPSTAVVVTAANGSYGWKGRWKKVKVLQNGATAVANARLYAY